MALKGNLSDTSVIQLLNLIHLARKTGRLVLEREGETARVAFRQGKLAWRNWVVRRAAWPPSCSAAARSPATNITC